MKYTVEGFSQVEMLKLGMDCVDAVLLRWFVDFMGTSSMKTFRKDSGELFYWISYDYLLQELPLIKIKTKDGLYRRLSNMKVLEQYTLRDASGSWSYFRVLPDLYACLIQYKSDDPPGLKSEGVRMTDRTIDPSINDPSILSKDNIKNLKSSVPIDKEVLNILQQVYPGSYNMKLPNEKYPEPTKSVIAINKILLSMFKGTFLNDYSFDEEWAKKQRINFDCIKDITSWTEIDRLLKFALKRLEQMKVEGYWPSNKKILPSSLYAFLYNPYLRTSWFIECLNKKPTLLNGVISVRDKEELPEKAQVRAEAFLKKHKGWSEPLFWSKMKKLYNFMEMNKTEFAQQSGFSATCGNTRMLLERLSEFEEEFTQGANDFQISAFGIDSDMWNKYFVPWLLKKEGINLRIRS